MCGLPTQIFVTSPHKFLPSLYKYCKIKNKMPGYSCLNYFVYIFLQLSNYKVI